MKNLSAISGVHHSAMDWEKDWDGAPKWLREILMYADHPFFLRRAVFQKMRKSRGGDKALCVRIAGMEKIATRETYGRDHPCYQRKIDKGFDPLVRRPKKRP